MCTPAAAAMGMQGAGSVVGAYGAYQSSQANKLAYNTQAKAADNQAAVDEWRASDALERGKQQAFSAGLRTAQVEGTQRATFAARGVALDEGSPLNILEDTKFMGSQDLKTINDNAAREAWVLRTSAANDRTNASMLRFRADSENPKTAALTTLLSGAGSVSKTWASAT